MNRFDDEYTKKFQNDSWIVVLVCYRCKKLIGTKENFEREKHNGRWYPVCLGCSLD
jgi:hypothetical protein